MHKLPLNFIPDPHRNLLHDHQYLCGSDRLVEFQCLDSAAGADNSKLNLPDNPEQNILDSLDRHGDGFHNNIPGDNPGLLPLPELPLLLLQRPRQGRQVLLPLRIDILPHCRPLPHYPVHGLVHCRHLLHDHCYWGGNGHQLQFWNLFFHC